MSNDKQVLSAQEAAAYLNAHVETIRRLARRGEIPSFKVGKDWRFRADVLRRWSEQRPDPINLPVLIVDDDPVVCRVLCRTVQRMGYRAVGVNSGFEGLQSVHRETPGLVLLDLLMPEMNGAEFLRAVRAMHPGLPVAIITGNPGSDLIPETFQYGPFLILAKPVNEKHLKSALQMSLGEDKWITCTRGQELEP